MKDTYTRNEIRKAILRGNRTVYFAFYQMRQSNVHVISRYELSLLGGRMA